MPKSRLLILDANVVIVLHERGLWAEVLARCEVHLARTVMDEANFYEDESGESTNIDLSADERHARMIVFDLGVSAINDFTDMFENNYASELDPGEKESLAYLVKSQQQFRICSGDHILYKVLGNLNLGDQGVSLEELLHEIGLGRKLDRRDSKKFREEHTAAGERDFHYGVGRRR